MMVVRPAVNRSMTSTKSASVPASRALVVNVWNDSQNGSDILSWTGDMLSVPRHCGSLAAREKRANILK